MITNAGSIPATSTHKSVNAAQVFYDTVMPPKVGSYLRIRAKVGAANGREMVSQGSVLASLDQQCHLETQVRFLPRPLKL